MKMIKKNKTNTKHIEMIKNEIKIMYMLNHINIVKLYTHFEDKD